MKTHVHYRYGVVSFVPDLTRPSKKTEPVAVIGCGDTDDKPFIFLIVATGLAARLRTEGDAISSLVLARLPDTLEEHLTQAVERAGSEKAIPWLASRLSANLVLSLVDDERATVDQADLVQETLKRFIGVLIPRPSRWSLTKALPVPPPAFRFEPLPAAVAV